MDNQENMIKNIFKNEIQIKRINKELHLLEQLDKNKFKITLKQLNNNLQIIVEIPPINLLNQGRPILFCIYLDNKFPFVFPKVHMLSNLTQPTLADGRDFIEDVLHEQWSPSILITQIIQETEKFIADLRKRKDNRDQLLAFGKYHQEQEYEGNLGLDDVEFFQYKEIINGKQQQKILQISSSYILILEYQNKQLILQSFQQTKDLIKAEKIDNNNALLTWRTDDNMRQQTIQLQNVDQFLDSVLMYKTGSSGKKIQEAEVTLQKFEKFQIQPLLDQITQLEVQLLEELNCETINKLMNAYQQAIEYYSAFSDDDFKEYVKRLQSLLCREDVEQILQNKTN